MSAELKLVQGFEKVCNRCGKAKPCGGPDSEFTRAGHAKQGMPRFRSQCRACIAELRKDPKWGGRASAKAWRVSHPELCKGYTLKYRYGGLDYEALWNFQRGLCGLCNEPMVAQGGGYDGASVDHDHDCCPETGGSCGNCIRALVHKRCNLLLANSQESIQVLEGAIRYLKSHPKKG